MTLSTDAMTAAGFRRIARVVALSYAQIKRALADRRLPAAFVDLDALDRNLKRICDQIRGRGTPLRIASKSLRVVDLLQRMIDHGYTEKQVRLLSEWYLRVRKSQ